MMSRNASKLAFPLLLLLAFSARADRALAARGPSTPEERTKALALVEVTETQPWSDAARDARAWLMKWLGDVPDITVKTCKSLLGAPEQRAGIPGELQDQILFSGLGYLLQHKGAGAGDTPTLTAALAGTLRAYESSRAHGAAAIPQLDALVKLRDGGQLETYVRGQGRACH